MNSEDGTSADFIGIVDANRKRLTEVITEVRPTGCKWVVECRDMWDAHDDDAGVYFVPCKTDRDVDRIAKSCIGDNPHTRLLGVLDVSRALDEQWPGLTLDQWKARRAADGSYLVRSLRELFNK